jgi:hypothetical protein
MSNRSSEKISMVLTTQSEESTSKIM